MPFLDHERQNEPDQEEVEKIEHVAERRGARDLPLVRGQLLLTLQQLQHPILPDCSDTEALRPKHNFVVGQRNGAARLPKLPQSLRSGNRMPPRRPPSPRGWAATLTGGLRPFDELYAIAVGVFDERDHRAAMRHRAGRPWDF